MDQILDLCLRCNNLSCRAALTDKAVVTTCSHIFCLRCASHGGLSQSNSTDRLCPACQSSLLNPDDVVSTILNPSEDYKTSVLSGLDPATIIACAGRALSFWTYQAAQEIFYQDHMSKSLRDKCGTQSKQMDQMAHEANSEIEGLQRRISELEITQDQLQKKNQELVGVYRDKCKKHAQMTNLYNLLKSRAMRSQIQTAVSDTVAQTLQTLGASGSSQSPGLDPNRSTTSLPSPRAHRFDRYTENSINMGQRFQQESGNVNAGATAMMPPPTGLINSPRNPNNVQATPQHRTRLPPTIHPNNHPSQYLSSRGYTSPTTAFRDSQHQSSTHANVSRGAGGHYNIHNFGAGVKRGRPANNSF
ncbi:hypothetical protein FQN57_002561 [Myotisia sp. PD_48]|nr:hypothetical protein FQN57_002561 [Myotisia sp. PD_48]